MWKFNECVILVTKVILTVAIILRQMFSMCMKRDLLRSVEIQGKYSHADNHKHIIARPMRY